ncbi:Wzz/FepE/Etk N-terminal domain-containing protein [Roseomonas sp. KE2513]|uniref:GumC family protein n=1 Tax=Roseomonas sp. KE2513 TaxID=2479202 RepID=UPI0018DFFE97|nr:Wzz/FepE/Etk N-terminal domain-containing protein [Roseomonas sp. KE2513]
MSPLLPAGMPPFPVMPSPSQGEVSLAGVMGAIRRRKRLIWGVLLLINGLTAVTALVLKPQYTATATVMIDPANFQSHDAAGGGRYAGGQEIDPSLFPTQINLLKSTPLAESVITTLGLAGDEELRPSVPLLTRLRGWMLEWPVTAAIVEVLPAPAAEAPRSAAQAAVPKFLDRLGVSQQRESRMISVSYRSGDPALAATVANTLVQQYIDGQVASKLTSIERAQRLASDRLAEAQRSLQEAEIAASAYMLANGLPRPGSNSAPDAQQPASLRRELAAAQGERAAREGRLAQLREMMERGANLLSLPEVGSSVTIQNLQQQAAALRAQEAQAAAIYGPNHPERLQVTAQRESIAARINEEVQVIVRGIQDEVGRARLREQQLAQALRQSNDLYVASESASIRLNELTRVVDTRSTAYRAILARLAELEEQRDAVQPQAAVIAEATVPQGRNSPRLLTIFLMGLGASLLLSLSAAALAEHLDSSLRGAGDVERALGVPSLALVPRVKRGWRREEPHHHVLARPCSPFTEAVRALGLGVRQAARPKSAKVLLVTSSAPGEGKTTLAISIAALEARTGRTAILVDLDLRSSSVVERLHLRRQAGVVEYVRGEAALDEIVQPVAGQERLHVISVREQVADPAAILSSPRMEELVSVLRQQYELIVLDVPPALGVADAQIVGQLADAALFVARWGVTTEATASNGLAVLERAGVNVVGCALTQVDPRQQALYGYHDTGSSSGVRARYLLR